MVRSIAEVCELEVVEEVPRLRARVRPARPGHAAVRRPRGREAVGAARRHDRRALGRRHRRPRRSGDDPAGRHDRARGGREGGRGAGRAGGRRRGRGGGRGRRRRGGRPRARRPRRRGRRRGRRQPTTTGSAESDEERDAEETADEPEPTFWEQVGIDPIRIVTAEGELLTLRCYLDDRPIFLGADGEIDTFPTRGALARFVADGAEGNDMASVSTWADVVERAAARELEVEVDPLNVYVLPGLDDDIAEGPLAVDPTQLEQAVELVRDVGDWAGDDEPRAAARRVAEPGLAGVVRDPARPHPPGAEPAVRRRRREVARAGRRPGEAARPARSGQRGRVLPLGPSLCDSRLAKQSPGARPWCRTRRSRPRRCRTVRRPASPGRGAPGQQHALDRSCHAGSAHRGGLVAGAATTAPASMQRDPADDRSTPSPSTLLRDPPGSAARRSTTRRGAGDARAGAASIGRRGVRSPTSLAGPRRRPPSRAALTAAAGDGAGAGRAPGRGAAARRPGRCERSRTWCRSRPPGAGRARVGAVAGAGRRDRRAGVTRRRRLAPGARGGPHRRSRHDLQSRPSHRPPGGTTSRSGLRPSKRRNRLDHVVDHA